LVGIWRSTAITEIWRSLKRLNSKLNYNMVLSPHSSLHPMPWWSRMVCNYLLGYRDTKNRLAF
jgi:hypothetical protein